MDSGWAVILGAGISLLGTSIVPWIRASLEEKRTREHERRARLEKPLLHLIQVVNSGEDEETPHDAFLRAFPPVNMLLGPNERKVALFIVTLSHIVKRADGDLYSGTLSTFTVMLSAWYAGRISPDELEHTRQEVLAEAREAGISLPDEE